MICCAAAVVVRRGDKPSFFPPPASSAFFSHSISTKFQPGDTTTAAAVRLCKFARRRPASAHPARKPRR